MKWLIFLLFVFSTITMAADVEVHGSSLASEQKPVAKQVSIFDSTQTKVEAWQLGGMATTLEFMFSRGLRLEIEDIQPAVTLREVEQYGELDRVRLYGIT